MKITDVRIRKRMGDEKLKAFASVTFDDCFVVHDIKIIQAERGLIVAMPSRRSSDGTYRDIVHPINREMREQLQTAILDRYRAEAEG